MGVGLVWIRAADFMTDWAFYFLSAQAPRFEFVMGREGQGYSTHKSACLALCILASLGLLPGLHGFYQKRIALGSDLPPPAETPWIALAVMLVEDLPQLILGSIYLYYMDKVNRELPEEHQEPVDPLAILSLTMSVSGLSQSSRCTRQIDVRPLHKFHRARSGKRCTNCSRTR